MWLYLSNPAVQLIILFLISGLVLGMAVFVSVRAHLLLRNKSKTISDIAADGERVNALLERYAGYLSD